MNIEQLKAKYDKDLEKSVDEAILSMKINNILSFLRIPNLISKITRGEYNGIVSFNKYSKRVIIDRLNIKTVEGEIPVTNVQ